MEPIFGLIIGIIFLFPLLHVLISSRSHGGAKFGWFLAMLFFSWIAWVVFLIMTQSEVDRIRR